MILTRTLHRSGERDFVGAGEVTQNLIASAGECPLASTLAEAPPPVVSSLPFSVLGEQPS